MNIDNLLRQHKEIYAILNSIKEMMSRNFNEFKNKFNTKSKLVNYECSVIENETLDIIRKIEERMEREEGDIYELC